MTFSTLRRWQRAFRASSFGSQIALTALTDLALGAAAFVTGTIVARLLGPVGRGELAAIQTWPTLIATLATLGIPNALVYFSAREPERAGRLMTLSTMIALLAGLPFVLSGYLAMPWLLGPQQPEVIATARTYLLLVPLMTLVGMPSHPLRGLKDITAWNITRALPVVAWVVVAVAGACAAVHDATLLALTYLAALLIVALPIWYIARRRIAGSFRPELEATPGLLRYGMPSVLSTLPHTLNLRLDQMMMAGLLGAPILGLYAVGVAWSSAVAPLMASLAAVALPRVAGAAAHLQGELAAQSARLGAGLALLLGGVVGGGAFVAVPLIFGPAFAPAVPAAIVLSAAAAVAAYNNILSSGAMGLGFPIYVLYAESAGLVATLLLLLLLLLRWQLMGAAIASLGSYLVITLVLLLFLGRQTGIPLHRFVVPRRSDFAAVLLRHPEA